MGYRCGKAMALVVLVIGVLFLLRDLNVWNFWNLQWWTVGFLLAGIGCLTMGCCPENQDKDLNKKKK